MRAWWLAPDGAENRRTELRVELNLTAELRVDGHVHPAVIQNLSRYGARVCTTAELCIATPIELVIVRDGRSPVRLAGTVVHRTDASEAVRQRTLAGVGVRFDDAVTRDPSTFAALIDGLHAPLAELPAPRALPVFATRPTRPMGVPLLTHLVDRSQTALADEPPRFAGTLTELSVPALLMLLEQTRKSGRLFLASAHLRATVDLLDGRIVDARSTLPGCELEEVLMFVLEWIEGTFELVRREVAGVDGRAPLAVTPLLLEHARLRDEATRRSRRATGGGARRAS